jgi:hypothetical protein
MENNEENTSIERRGRFLTPKTMLNADKNTPKQGKESP